MTMTPLIPKPTGCCFCTAQHSFSNGVHHLHLVPSVPLRKKVAAEFVCTFILVFFAVAGPITHHKYYGGGTGAASLLRSAVGAGLTVTVCIFSGGHISGAHMNPAVTVALATIRRFPWSHVPAYFTVQTSASICAAMALKFAFRPFDSAGVTVPSVGTGQAFGMEFLATFMLMFVVTAVATNPTAAGMTTAVAVGSAIVIDTLVFGAATGASMNPTRSLGTAVVSGNYKQIWIYLIAPVLGAVTAAIVYILIKVDSEDRMASETQI